MLRKLIGWPVANALYYIGHGASRVVEWLDSLDDDGEPGPVFNTFWRIYQGSMALSVDVNDWAGLKVWGQPDNETDAQG